MGGGVKFGLAVSEELGFFAGDQRSQSAGEVLGEVVLGPGVDTLALVEVTNAVPFVCEDDSNGVLHQKEIGLYPSVVAH